MRRIEVGIHQADGYADWIDPVERLDETVQRCGRQRHLDAAVCPHSFRNANAAVARDEGRRLLRIEGIDLAPNVAADLEDILKSCRGHERSFGKLALKDRIGGDRRAVEQKADIGKREAVTIRRFLDSGHQTNRRVFRRCRRLIANDRTRASIIDLQVSKSAADVNADPDRRYLLHRHLNYPSYDAPRTSSDPTPIRPSRQHAIQAFLWAHCPVSEHSLMINPSWTAARSRRSVGAKIATICSATGGDACDDPTPWSAASNCRIVARNGSDC